MATWLRNASKLDQHDNGMTAAVFTPVGGCPRVRQPWVDPSGLHIPYMLRFLVKTQKQIGALPLFCFRAPVGQPDKVTVTRTSLPRTRVVSLVCEYRTEYITVVCMCSG